MIRKATLKDYLKIVAIIESGIKYIAITKSPQWQIEFPYQELIKKDILNKKCYLLLSNKEIIGTFSLYESDASYNYIKGNWLNKRNNYFVIHRIAVKYYQKGIGQEIIEHIISLAKKENKSIRVDTHYLNIAMQNLLLKNNFSYCGTINLLDKKIDRERLAYERII
ncbi:MAG: GNAT family N-acetyltransferase [Bacillales bacterium]|jgi:RimJ/RimL family protein N-acetyltransferase|nr:GNAT family N-acetyltransferase [Bacillales bacterium]